MKDIHKPERVGVIISTFNHPEWLKKVLWGYRCQSRPADEIIVADDGSTPETREMLERLRVEFDLPIKHVWHTDGGFQKNTIVNAAIQESTCDYLIFTDQDCIPRRDFVNKHLQYSRKGRFLSGGYFKLPMELSIQLTQDDIFSKRAFNLNWLMKNGVKWHFKCTKLIRFNGFSWVMNHITTAKATWNGCNSSGWKNDILRVNGFNEALRYGGEDRELGERLNNLAIYGIQIRYSAICLHLDHERPYKEEALIRSNKTFRKSIRKSHISRTLQGIYKDPEEFSKLPHKVVLLSMSKIVEPVVSGMQQRLTAMTEDVQTIRMGAFACRKIRSTFPDIVVICTNDIRKIGVICSKVCLKNHFKLLIFDGETLRNQKLEIVAILEDKSPDTISSVLYSFIHN